MNPDENLTFENIVKELSQLGRRKPPKGKELNRAKQLIISLREMGYTSAEIANLTARAPFNL